MRYFFGSVTTQYNGMEWGQDFLVLARNGQSAERKANRHDWTHGDGIEYQEEANVQEIPPEHYEVLHHYLLVLK